MSVKGKVIGTLLGLLGGPGGAFIGGIVGHLLDSSIEEQPVQDIPGSHHRFTENEVVFLSTFIGLSVTVLSIGASDRIPRIKAVIEFLDRCLRVSQENQTALQRIIEEGIANKDPLDVQALCRSYTSVSSQEGRKLLLEFLLKVAVHNNSISREEEAHVRVISRYLDITDSIYYALRARALPFDNELYGVLEVEPTASDGDIRKSYRRLVRFYHPDRYAQQNQEALKQAEESFKAIQNAYSKVRQSRGM